MARNFVAGTLDMAYRDPHVLAGIGGVCITFWLNRADNTQVSLLFEYDQTNGFDYVTQAVPPGPLIRSYFSSGAAWADNWNVAQPATGTWHHYFIIIPGTGEGVPPPVPNQIWLDGVNQTLTTNSHTNGAGTIANSAPYTVMGRRLAGVNSRWLSGAIAEFAMWSSHTMIVSPAPFVKQLVAGAHPLRVRQTECIMYVPYYGVDNPEPDFHGAQRSFTLAGAPTRINHPPKVRGFVNFQD